MPISQGLPIYLSTAANIGTRVKGPVVAGQAADGVLIPAPGGAMCVQSTASLINQVVTTSATGQANASHIYIPVTTGSFVGSTGLVGSTGALPAYQGCGTPIVWDDTNKNLNIWSSSLALWMRIGSSAAGTGGFVSTSTT